MAHNVHVDSLATSSALAGYYVANIVLPQDVIRVLNREGIRFVLVGAHGIGGWTGEPRATQDVDVVVGVKLQKKAVRVLLHHFPHLIADDQEVVTRLRDKETKKVLIDVMKANQPLYREAFKYTHKVETGKVSYLIPCLEMALAMKFAPMISLTREDDRKHLDARDFIRIVRENANIDEKKLEELGQLVYNGGGQEILELVRKVRAGEKLVL